MIFHKTNTIAFRAAIPSDHVRIASLHTDSWRRSYRGILRDAYLDHEIGEERERLWRERLSAPDIDRRYVLLAEIRTDLVGFVCVLLDEETEWGACLDNLHVRFHIRGLGLGRRLFAEAARWVTSKEPGWPIHAWVFEANDSARGFYDTTKGEILEREIKQMPGGAKVLCLRWHRQDLVGHFPEKIPPDAKNAVFYYRAGFLQGGSSIELRVHMPEEFVEEVCSTYEPQAKFIFRGAERTEKEPDDPDGPPKATFFTFPLDQHETPREGILLPQDKGLCQALVSFTSSMCSRCCATPSPHCSE